MSLVASRPSATWLPWRTCLGHFDRGASRGLPCVLADNWALTSLVTTWEPSLPTVATSTATSCSTFSSGLDLGFLKEMKDSKDQKTERQLPAARNVFCLLFPSLIFSDLRVASQPGLQVACYYQERTTAVSFLDFGPYSRLRELFTAGTSTAAVFNSRCGDLDLRMAAVSPGRSLAFPCPPRPFS